MTEQQEPECEIKVRQEWVRIPLSKALAMHADRTLRCVECHGRVTAHQAGRNGSKSHFEHHKRNAGCSLGDCFDGTPRQHPSSVA